MGEGEALPWLKAMPLAPEFYPTEAELADPVAYILKIEKEASQYGICKIIPPIPKSSKKAVIANLNLCLGQNNNINTTAASGLYHGSSVNNNVLLNDNGVAKFSTRQQQIGWSLKRSRGGGPVQTVVQKSVWQSGETYTLEQFEAKAKLFSRSRLKTTKDVAPLIVETLFWKASADKPITVEYANDIPGTAFGEPNKKLSPPSTPSVKRKGKKRRQCKQKKDEGSHDVCEISNTAWNMRIVSRSNGSLLRYMPVEVAGVTSPMIYIAMLFSWFAWHVEDHDLHSLNYLHMGAPKTWYAVPGEAASAFEEVVRQEGYGGQVNPLVAFAMLGEKTTVMSPEVLIAAGVPCCRLVQNAGEFVVTFPRAYHLGFSHGFNCGEAANLATPEWLKVAKEAAVRRAATKFLPMLSHQQLLYLLALGSTSRIPVNVGSEPRSSRLKYRQRGGGEMIVKKRFLNDVIENNKLLSNLLQKTSTQHAILWNSANVSCDFPSSPLCFSTISETKSRASLRVDGMDVSTLPSETAPNISTPACRKDSCIESSLKAAEKETSSRIGSSLFNNVKQENVDSSYYAEFSSLHNNDNDNDKGNKAFHRDILSSERDADTGPLACIVCGVLGFASMAVIQPCQEAASVLFSTNCMIGQNYFMTDGAAATHSETHFMADKNGLNNKIVQLNQHGAATAYKNTYAYQHVGEKMDMVNMKAIVQSESLEPIGESSGLFSESNNQKEFPSSIPNDACMPNALSVGNNLGMPQITALDLLAATYGDSMDSDEENDSNITNTSNHVCRPSNGALVSEIRHDLCDTADSPKVNVYASKDPNLQGSPHLSSCALAGKVRKDEETHDVLISGGLKPENKCSFVDTGPKDSFSNSMRMDTNVAGDSSIRSPDQYPNRNMTLHSSVSEDWNGFQGETNVSDIQFPVVEGNNELQKHISAPSVFENVLDTILDISLKETLDSSVLPSNQLGDPSEVSGNNKKPSDMIISHTRDSKGDLTQTELIAEKYNLEVIPESKSYTRDHEAAKSGIDGCTHCFETPHVYDCQPSIQDPLHYESKETHANNDGSISMSIRSNKTRTCDIVGATRSHAAETGSLQGKPYDTPRQSTNAASFWKPTKGFLRPRVFCLEHALEIKEQLQPMGGAHFLILCHLSYPIMEQQARLLATEIGNDYSWNDIPFKNVASEDLEVIHLAIDDGEDTEPGSSDWTMQLGVNLQYSVKLSKSPLYSTQMPYNQVLEALFLNSYLNNYTAGSAYGSAWDCDMKKQGKKSKHKKITVAGKWCGRVWMVNQVHPFLRSCEVQPSASFGAETIKIGVNQEQGHIQKCMVQEVDCKPILKQRTIITSDKDMVAHQEDSHFQKYTGQDPDSKLILKPRMTITSDKAVTFTRNDQLLMTYRKNTHNPPISRRSAVKGKMCSERQINNIKAEPSEYTTVSVDERTPLPNQRKEFQEDSTMTIAEDAKLAASCVTRMKQREKVVGHGNYVQAKNNHYQGDMSQADIEIQYSKGNIGENIGGIHSKTNRQSGLKDEVEVLTYQSSEVQCLENTLISNSHAVSHSYSSTGELEGGPCTRLRPRSTKPKVEVVNKVADKALQQSVSSKTIFKGKKKVAKAVPSKNDEDKNTYCCDTEGCTMKFSSKHDINLHKRNICAFKGCGKHFFSHKYLVQHRRVHLDERPLSCPWEGCEMTFKWAWARTEHIRVHTGERPYVCTTAGCGQTFRFVSDFSRHKRKTGHLPKK